VVVAVIAVRVVKPVSHHVIDVVAMRHRLMPTVGTVLMRQIVPSGGLCVLRRMLVVDSKTMLVDVAVVRMMQMPVVQIVDVIAVAHSDVPAARAMGMWVVLMNLTGHGTTIALELTAPKQRTRVVRSPEEPAQHGHTLWRGRDHCERSGAGC
jgi:hypothetical protein